MHNNLTPVKIAGGGIAGLAAAMYLRKKNFKVVVYEKESKIGNSRHGDFEGIENWIFSNSIQNLFNVIGFSQNQISLTPVKKFLVHSANDKPLKIKSESPFFNLVSRGSKSNDLDSQLYEQCLSAGVQFQFGKKAPSDSSIIATGTRKASAYIYGMNFKTKSDNQIHLFLGRRFAPKGYAYLIIQDGKGTIATAFKKNHESNQDLINNCMYELRKLNIDIYESKAFGSRGSFILPLGLKCKPPFLIGEAGGFQDYLFGFGMKISMISGLAAGMYLAGKKSHSKGLFLDLNKKRKISFINRILYERLNDKQMYDFAKKFSTSDDPLKLLSSAYQWKFKTLLRWINFKNKYEVRTT